MFRDMMNDLVGRLHHQGPGEILREDPHRHDGRSGGIEMNRQTGGVTIRRVRAITPEADHATATGDAIGIMMTGTDDTREEVPVLMTGIEGGPREGLLHQLVGQVRQRSRVFAL